MDLFKEQIVKVKKTNYTYFIQGLIWLFAVAITAVTFLLIKGTPLFIIAGAVAGYCAYKVTTSFNIEYEYTITNGLVDIDKIINKASRKEIVSFESKNIEEIYKYNKDFVKDKSKKIIVCTDDFENSLIIGVNTVSLGKCYIVFSPNEDLIDLIKTFAPRSITREFFK